MFTRKGSTKQPKDIPQSPHASTGATAEPHNTAHATDTRASGHEQPGASRFPPPPLPDTTSIGKNFNLEGENIVIRCKGALAINGNVGADIHCEQLTIGDSASIEGNIAADEVIIHGNVRGTINGAQVTLLSSSQVAADINAGFLSIERGAHFDGRSQRVEDVSTIAPQLMSSANDTESPSAHQEPDTATEASQPAAVLPTHLEPATQSYYEQPSSTQTDEQPATTDVTPFPQTGTSSS